MANEVGGNGGDPKVIKVDSIITSSSGILNTFMGPNRTMKSPIDLGKTVPNEQFIVLEVSGSMSTPGNVFLKCKSKTNAAKICWIPLRKETMSAADQVKVVINDNIVVRGEEPKLVNALDATNSTYVQDTASVRNLYEDSSGAGGGDDFEFDNEAALAEEYEQDPMEQTRKALEEWGQSVADIKNDRAAGYSAQSFRSILGLPFQFTPQTDPRIGDAKYGRMFNEIMLMDMPIATILPGGPKFLHGKDITKEDKESIVNIISNIGVVPTQSLSEKLENILEGKNARFYTFLSQPAIYQKYANTFIRLASRYAGVDSKKYRGEKLSLLNYITDEIETDGGRSVRTIFGSTYALNLLIDPTAGSNESVSNSSGQPSIASVINGSSQKVREMDVLFGAGAGINLKGSQTSVESNVIDMSEFNPANADNFISRMFSSGKQGFKTVMAGANMLIPDIWQDSSLGRSHDIKVRLISPYGDALSVFWHILRPMGLIIPLGMPRQFGANGYTTPFIVQSFSKGNFNCEMGIVESLQIERAGNGELQSLHNMPTEVIVTLSIKDLYPTLAMSRDDNYNLFVNNIGLLDFLASFTGVSLNKPEAMRKLQTLGESYWTRITDIPASIKMNIWNATRDAMRNLFRG